jgi:hypothetical protein
METKKIWQLMLVLTPLVGLAACSSDSTSTDTVATAETTVNTFSDISTTISDGSIIIEVVVGENSGPDRVEEVPLGAEVTLQFTNPDADDEYHVHGYDLGGGVTKKGEMKTFTFTADKAGDYEIESHISEKVLAVIRVQ